MLVDILNHTQLEDDMPIIGDVQVVISTLDLELERAALAGFLHAASVEDMNTLLSYQSLELGGRRPALTALPEAFGHLTALRSLFLHSNRLTTLPQSFGQLTCLEELSLQGNQLTALPESICGLSSL